jgi:hypothetical protein
MAKAARENVRDRIKGKETTVTVVDDYGHQLSFEPNNCSAILIQDGQLSAERTNDQNIDTARANDVFIKRRNEDMELMRLFPGNQMLPQAGRS